MCTQKNRLDMSAGGSQDAELTRLVFRKTLTEIVQISAMNDIIWVVNYRCRRKA